VIPTFCESVVDVQYLFIRYSSLLTTSLSGSLSPVRWLVVVGVTLINSFEAASKTTSSSFREKDSSIPQTGLYEIQDCFLLFANVTIYVKIATELTSWWCCKLQQSVKIQHMNFLIVNCEQTAKEFPMCILLSFEPFYTSDLSRSTLLLILNLYQKNQVLYRMNLQKCAWHDHLGPV